MHGVGHSNGALLHALIGALLAPPNASNALISFNNKCALPGSRAGCIAEAVFGNRQLRPWMRMPGVKGCSWRPRQVKDAIPLSLGPIQAAVASLRAQPWAAGIPSADGLITRCSLKMPIERNTCRACSWRPG